MTKPGALSDLALTLPIFLAYQLGVVFLDVRNGADLVTEHLIELSHGNRLLYLGLTAAIGLTTAAVFALLGRGDSLHPRKLAQICLEGVAYAIAMGVFTSWIVGKVFALPSAGNVGGTLPRLVTSLGAGFYEELGFRVVLFGLGAKLAVWCFLKRSFRLVAASPGLGLDAVAIITIWAIVSALTFSGMHYVGALGDPFDLRSFVARAVLGLALTLIYSARGFAAAVWTHALYDIWVLVM